MSVDDPIDESTRPPRKSRRKRLRIVIYSGLLLFAGFVYFATNFSIIPGYDPYFAPRETIDPDILEVDGRRYLWGGTGINQRFDITDFRLNPKHLESAVGREKIPAVTEPRFMSAQAADSYLKKDSRVLVAKVGGEVKVYPIKIMERHGVVNDVIGGRPVLAAYCLLSDLGAVYDRTAGDLTYTFGVSGYTYYDWKTWRGYSAFVLWDRETESLWWPPLGKAVSGPSVDVPLKLLDRDLWAQTSWGEIRDAYPDAQVLHRYQGAETDADWPRKDPPSVERLSKPVPRNQIAPRWGRNDSL